MSSPVSSQQKIYCLRDVDIYEGVPEDEIIRLTDEAIEQHCIPGHTFYHPESPADQVYVIKSGEIELIRERHGKRVVIETLFAGDVFGDFGMGATTHTAVVIKRAYVCQTPTTEFLNVVRNYPEMALRLMKTLAEKTAHYEQKLVEAHYPAKDKLFAEIQFLELKHKQKIFGKIFNLPLRISHQRLAEKTGLNRVTVTKLLNELRQEGQIFVDENTGALRTHQ